MEQGGVAGNQRRSGDAAGGGGRLQRLRIELRRLYNGRSRRSERFRYARLVFDIITIGVFVVDSVQPPFGTMVVADTIIAGLLIADFAAQLLIAKRPLRYLLEPLTLVDMLVIATLLAPFLIENWAFLRVLRALRMLRSYRVLQDLRRRFRFFARNQQVIAAAINLVVFVFVVTALVFVTQRANNPQIVSYVDALYFTVATLTTTGFGDITLKGQGGRLLSVLIMLVGFSLFFRLVQAVFRPPKVYLRCPDCGLSQHDPDAVHCKHCGRVIHIETEGSL